ncbi:MAG TPA: transketolase C-terminal domain-containing protein, partial [Nitrospirota bacterium]|nr:transketolase C-terminal domain-containing protein [Nitrospirota bacterium]
ADGVPPFVTYGKGYRYHMTSNVHDDGGFPATNNHQIADILVRRLHDKVENRRSEIVLTEEIMTEDAEIIIFAYGCTARSAYSAVEEVRKQGKKVGLIKALTLWPFPSEVLLKYSQQAKHVIVPEMNLGQLVGEAERALKDCPVKVKRLNRIDGRMITPEQIMASISEVT